jgi:hypothetical protein
MQISMRFCGADVIEKSRMHVLHPIPFIINLIALEVIKQNGFCASFPNLYVQHSVMILRIHTKISEQLIMFSRTHAIIRVF